MTWLLKPADEAEVDRLASALGLPRPVARVMWLRGYAKPEVARAFLASRDSLDYLQTPLATEGMQRAIARIRRAVDRSEPMVVYGDYDCDGVTASTLLYRYLARGMKAHARAYLPDRFKDGYGVTPQAVERLAAEGVKLIVTCDNGISAHPAAAAAAACGVDLVVTDHHQVPEELPHVYSIVHPQVEFAHLKDLAGVGVAYLLTLALEGGFTARMETFLDLVAIGTVADMVPLNGPNRPLVWAGIERMRTGKMLPGVRALGELTCTTWSEFSPQHIGFRFGPRLNAAGRLETPDVGFRLLATNDPAEAMAYAQELDRLNAQRRELNAELEGEILARIERELDLDAEPFVVLADAGYHHGITGIVAGRIKERYRVPVLLFSDHGDGVWKGSGRSPEGLHLYEALHACRKHLLGFGGHAQAAGCSALGTELAPLRQALNRYVSEIGWSRPADIVWLDALLPFHEADEALLGFLETLEPFGQKNPAPVFGLTHARLLGKRVNGKRVALQIDDGQSVREVIAWRPSAEVPHAIEAMGKGWVHLWYQPQINSFRGQRELQYMAQRIEAAEPPAPVDLEVSERRALSELEDRRGEPAHRLLEGLAGKVTVYANRGRVEDLDPRLVAAMRACRAGFTGPATGLVSDPGVVVCADVPADELAWTMLRARSTRLVLAWDEPEPEPEITPLWLQQFYFALAQEPAVPLRELAMRIAGEHPLLGLTALAIFREAGILVERGAEWSVLRAPLSDIPLRHLRAFQQAMEARAWRERMARAPVATLL